jgi:hypothetical protein
LRLLTPGLAARIATLAAMLVVGSAALAPAATDAPATAARVGASTAAQKYGWGRMMWDFAWEFGESFDSPPYRGTDTTAGSWTEDTDGTGRVAKYGGGVEFHSALVRNGTDDPDFGDSTLTLDGQPADLGRWEVRERSFQYEKGDRDYDFLLELIPSDPAGYDCGAHNITIARMSPGNDRVTVGVNAGAATWSQAFSGYRQNGSNYAFAVEVTRRRITWFINGRAVASVGASEAMPRVPLTVRMRLVGEGTAEMNKSVVKIDWVRHYDLTRGTRAPTGEALTRRSYDAAC